MPSASKTIVQLLVASVALAVKVPAHSPSRGQMLLQVSANAQLRSFVEPTFHSGRDTGLEKASLVEMLRHAKDAAHHALEAGGSADRNATQAAWAQDIIDAITDDIVPGIFADHKLDQARLNDSASKINNCLTSLQDTNETTLAPGIAGASSNKADMQIQTKVLEDLNETSLMLCNATHTRLASHTCILPALPLPDEMASYMDCVQKWLLASQILHTRCDDAHSNFSAQEKFATGLLQNYTLRSCSTASDIINTCGVYTACRVEHDSDFTQVVAAAKTSVSGRMTEMQALKKIACFLGVAKMSPAELATDSGASKFSSCEREEDADAEDLLLVFPSISTAIVCPLPTVAATGCVRRPGCVFGAPVFITSESQQHLRENPDGSIGLGSTTDAAAQWTLSDAGHGTVLISSYSGKHLQDLEGTVTLDRNLQAGEQWTLQATGTGDFLVTSHNGQHLQDFEGILLGDEVRSAAKWTIVLEDDGTPACLALPDAETALPGQTQAPTPEMARGQSTPSPDTSVVTSTMSTTAVPTTAVPTTAAPTLEVTTFDGYGGGWTFVNEAGRSKTDVNDVATISLGGYFLPVYQIVAPFKEVLVQRISDNWCDSWRGQSGYWVASSGASMGVQADLDFWYTYNNHGGDHTWLRQSTSYLPPGSCDACWVHPGNGNEYDTHGVTIESLELDGSVVLITFPVFKDMLKVGNLDSFYGQAGGCDAEGPVSYRVYTRTQVAPSASLPS